MYEGGAPPEGDRRERVAAVQAMDDGVGGLIGGTGSWATDDEGGFTGKYRPEQMVDNEVEEEEEEEEEAEAVEGTAGDGADEEEAVVEGEGDGNTG